MPDIRQLLRDAYTCKACPRAFGFVDSPNGSYFKFPPTIGAHGKADILFVGINPRRSRSNLALHEQLMTSKRAFADLSANRYAGQPYISTTNGEAHYLPHLEIIRQVFDRPQPFESCAIVTELFLCASENSKGLPQPDSPCASRFLPNVIAFAQPKVIVAVGSRVFNFFQTDFGATISRNIHVVKMPHPGNSKLSPQQRRAQTAACVAKLREHLL